MKICWGEFIQSLDSLLGLGVMHFLWVLYKVFPPLPQRFSSFFLLHFRKGLDVDIVTANASKESDKLQILNSIALPRAATKQLQMDAAVCHERDSEMKTWAM